MNGMPPMAWIGGVVLLGGVLAGGLAWLRHRRIAGELRRRVAEISAPPPPRGLAALEGRARAPAEAAAGVAADRARRAAA